MFGLFGDKSEREIKHLNKAAREVIEHARQTLRAETMRDIAHLTKEHLDRVSKIYGDDPVGPKRAIVEYQSLHGEARRSRDDVALTAFTLVLISARSEKYKDRAQGVCDTLNAFIAEWAHAQEN
ncbi:MAG: hypothetical protein HQ512_10475 [Rhodospirillales bacterium]|nr:hypothetical protein [Rhodospirillales bacterium]